MKPVDLLGKKVGDGYSPYIISEIGVNFKTFEQGKTGIDFAIVSRLAAQITNVNFVSFVNQIVGNVPTQHIVILNNFDTSLRVVDSIFQIKAFFQEI